MAGKINDPKSTDGDSKFVKDKDAKTGNFIFQNNKITKIGVIIIVAFLILLVIGVIASGVFISE